MSRCGWLLPRGSTRTLALIRCVIFDVYNLLHDCSDCFLTTCKKTFDVHTRIVPVDNYEYAPVAVVPVSCGSNSAALVGTALWGRRRSGGGGSPEVVGVSDGGVALHGRREGGRAGGGGPHARTAGFVRGGTGCFVGSGTEGHAGVEGW